MDKQCEIVQDLLPLYVDGACSESSTEMIKEHLSSCSACTEIYQRLCSHTNEDVLQNEKSAVVARHGKMVKRKRVMAIILAVVFTLTAVLACINLWPASVDYGNSEVYSRQDMDEALKLIKERFYSWDGCKLYSISYAGDDFCERELDYCNSLADDGITYTECIVFRMRFRSPIFGGGAWNPNFEYDWSWYLARTDGGEWNLLTWGAP